MSQSSKGIWSFQGKNKVLHMSWFAFFLSFFVWFNFAPFATTIQKALNLSSEQIKTLLICNIALTIPTRIIIGMLVDRFGPRKTYTTLLVTMSFPCFLFAMAQSFEQMVILRILLSCIGSGFVIGIRMIGEWFGPKEVGMAEGIYGGWGNFGSAAAAFTLPSLALLFSDANGWRLAIGFSGALCLGFAPIYYRAVRDTPSGKTYFSPKKISALEVSSYPAMYALIIMTLPMVLCLGILVWKLQTPGVAFISSNTSYVLYGLLSALYIYQVMQILKVNLPHLKSDIHEADKYEFRQVGVLNIAYAASFGSELAVVSMLPAFFEKTFGLSVAAAGIIGSCFAFMNLLARPMGGVFSDRFGRRGTLLVLFSCLFFTYIGMGFLNSSWPLVFAIMLTMLCSFCVQSAEGAVFSIVPLIKRRITGQIAGMVGAYGNVGGVCFLTIYSLASPQVFFYSIAGFSLISLASSLALKDPKGKIMEVQPDGTIEMLEVA